MSILKKGLSVFMAAALAVSCGLPGMAASARAETAAPTTGGEYVVGRFQYEDAVAEKDLGGNGFLGVTVDAPVPVDISGRELKNLAVRFSMRVTRSDGVTGPGSLSRLRNGYVDIMDSAGSKRAHFGSPTQNGVAGDMREADKWMDVSFPLSAMSAGTDRLTSVTVGDYNDFPNKVEGTGDFEFPDGADTGMFLEVKGLRIVDTSMDSDGNPIPQYTLTTFKGFGGTYAYNGANLWYADWKYADVYPVDLSGDRSGYRLQMTMTFASEDPSVDLDTCWSHLTVKLRSTDVAGKPGDPDTTDPENPNREHNIGWDFTPANLELHGGTARISIDLSGEGTNKRGLIDWSQIEKIITIGTVSEAAKDKISGITMTLSDVQIVDLAAVQSIRDALKAEIDRSQQESLFSEADRAVYQAAKTDAQEIYADESASVADLQNALASLKAAGLAGDAGKAALKAALEELIDRTQYTDASLNAYDAAHQAAKLVFDAKGATTAAVDKALQSLKDAKAELEPFSGVRYGDVNGKDGVTAEDALLVLQAATKKVALSDNQQKAADVDGKNGVTAEDALLILQYVTKKIDAFPAAGDDDLTGLTEVKISDDPLTFCNPLNLNYEYQANYNGSREAADPAVVVYKGEYYLFASHNEGYWYSPDLYDWTYVQVDLTDPVQKEFKKFAPATMVIDDTLYITHSESGAILKTTDPKNPDAWVSLGQPYKDAGVSNWGDPALLYNDPATGGDGYVYAYEGTSSDRPIVVMKFDPNDNMKMVAGPVDCIYPDPVNHGFEVNGENNTKYDTKPFLEGAWINKYEGKYYLTYGMPGTQFGSYADGCYVADDPMGPFSYCENSPVIWKASGFMRGAGHGCLFEDLDGNWWKVDTVSLSVNTGFERRLALFPAMFDEAGDLYANTVRGDYPTYRPSKSEDPFFATGPDWQLLSYGKEMTASSTLNRGKSPQKAADENMKTWWSAATGSVGEYLQVDLGRLYGVWSLQVNFADQDTENNPNGRKGNFSYHYKVEFSQDGETWLPVVDRTQNDSETSHDYYEFAGKVGMRYVRVTNTGDVPQKGKFAISDLRVFGDSTGSKPEAVTDFKVERYQENERSVSLSWDPVPGAQGYILRFGVNKEALYNHYQVIGGNGVTLNCLNMGVDYYFSIDSYNEGGATPGTVVKKAPWTVEPAKPDKPVDPDNPDTDPPQPDDPTPVEKIEGFAVYEAEAADYGNEPAISSGTKVGLENNAAASGGKVVNNMHTAGSYVEFTGVDAGPGGTATLRIAYANGNSSHMKAKLSVNRTALGDITLPLTSDWSTFVVVSIPLTGLNAGTDNVIRLEGCGGGFNADFIQLIYTK